MTFSQLATALLAVGADSAGVEVKNNGRRPVGRFTVRRGGRILYSRNVPFSRRHGLETAAFGDRLAPDGVVRTLLSGGRLR